MHESDQTEFNLEDLERYTKLEIGSGKHPTPGYLHIDMDPEALHVEIAGDVRAFWNPDIEIEWFPELGILSEMKFEEIKLFDFVEHVEWIHQISMFKFFRSILTDEGKLNIRTPDGEYILDFYCMENKLKKFPKDEYVEKFKENEVDFWKWLNFKLFSGCSRFDKHHCLYSKKLLHYNLSQAGFQYIIIRRIHGSLHCIAYKTASFRRKVFERIKKVVIHD